MSCPCRSLTSRMACRLGSTVLMLGRCICSQCSLINAGAPEADEGLRRMQACMDSCGNLGLASLRLQSVTTAMCACGCVLSGHTRKCNPASLRQCMSMSSAVDWRLDHIDPRRELYVSHLWALTADLHSWC